ncbi:MAG TPA: OmpA family protein [Anaeromyxobacter sp.]|nr:OmpA family protein [Anaeromyxobacter sp.]
MRTARMPIALAALVACSAAIADDPTARGFDPDPTRPAVSLDGGFTLETAAAAPRGRMGAAFLLDWTEGLLALRLGDAREDALASRLSAHLLAAASLGRLELGVDLPVALYQRSDLSLLESQGVTGPLVAPIARSALGDLRLVAKLPVLEAARAPFGIGLAALLDLRAPTGDRAAFTGEGPMAVPGVVATRTFGRARLDAQVGYVIRERGQWAQLVANDGVTWSLGGSWDVPALGAARRWRAIAEVGGAWPRGNDLSTDRHRAPLSARTGLRAFLSDRLAVELGGGTGLGAAGYGRESWRVFGGVRFALDPAREEEGEVAAGGPDRDRDGVPDARDACRDVPGPAELDGCPDGDGDEIPDREDRCPGKPGPATREGCPVEEQEPLVEIETERLSLNDAIQFDTGRDTLRSQSFPVLDAIHGILAAHPELRRVRIEGHTDDVGTNAYNKDLSDRRARTVVRYLTGKGIARERLEPSGFGEDRPVASNATALGRAKNRRVEFTIVDGTGAR